MRIQIFSRKLQVDKIATLTESKRQLRLDYIEAQEMVGEEQITRLETMMREKLNQRTSAGPFQLRKTFKSDDVAFLET